MQAVLLWCRHHLLPLLTLLFILGLVAARSLALDLPPAALPFWFPHTLLALVLLCLLAMLILPAQIGLVAAALPLFFCLGLVHGWHALQAPTNTQHINHMLEERSRVSIYGRVLGLVERNGERSRCILAAYGLLHHVPGMGTEVPPADFIPVSGRVELRVRGQLAAEIVPGTAVMVLGWADKPQKQRNPGGFDAALHYAAQGIDAIMWLQSGDALLHLAEPEPSLAQRLRFVPEKWRQHSAHFLQNNLPPEVAGVYQALLIGSRQGVSPDLLERFKASGCMHILAISGLHLSLVAGMVAVLLYWLCKRSTWLLIHGHAPTMALVCTAPILLLYASLAGMNIPVLRALVSALLVLCAVVLRRHRLQLHLVAGAALLLLALNPLALFTASFQLSFSAVAALVLILPRLPWFTEKQTAQGHSSRISRIWAAVLSVFLVSLAATLGTLPFMLHHFNRVSLIGPLMNILVQPLLCLWALPLGLLALPVLPLFPNLALAILQVGGLGIQGALYLLAWAEQLPFASLWTITPHSAEMLLFFLILLLWMQNWPRRNVWRASAALLSAILLCSLTTSLWLPLAKNELRISFIDVGQGAASLMELPDGQRILLDAGGYQQSGYDVGSRIVAPFLWQRRIWRLDAVVVSHADADHYSGMPFLIDRFAPQKLFVSPSSAIQNNDNAYCQMLQQAQKQGVQIQEVQGRQLMVAKDDLVVELLGPTPAEEAQGLSNNDRSLVLRLRYGHRAFLFPADITFHREALLQEAAQEGRLQLQADLLVAGHHGSSDSTSPAFLDAVAPQVVVVSAGASRRGTHPAPAHLDNWQQRGLSVFNTATSGMIEAQSNGQRLCVRSATAQQCFE
jgi:competence protein ComEC